MLEKMNDYGKFLTTEFNAEQLALVNILIYNSPEHTAYRDLFESGNFEECKKYLLARKSLLVIDNVPAEKLSEAKRIIKRSKSLLEKNKSVLIEATVCEKKISEMSPEEVSDYLEYVIAFIGSTRPEGLNGAMLIVLGDDGVAHYHSNVEEETSILAMKGLLEKMQTKAESE